MVLFKIKTISFANVQLITQQGLDGNQNINIHINQKIIEIPLLVAASLSAHFARQFITDKTTTDLFVKVNFPNKRVEPSILNKIEKLLNSEEVDLTNDEVDALALFGKAIENDEFIAPYEAQLEELEKNITVSNVVDLLKKRIAFDYSPEVCQKEITFIAQHFTETKDNLLKLFITQTVIIYLQYILQSDELSLINEDELLYFILELSSHDTQCASLFEYVKLEYCSPEAVQQLSIFTISLCNDRLTKSVLLSMSRRLKQNSIPMKDRNEQTRYRTKQYKTIPLNNQYIGIFRRAHGKGNVIMNPSTIARLEPEVHKYFTSYEPEHLFDGCKRSYFATMNAPNSFISLSLKNGKAFIPSDYMIMGNTGTLRLNSWRIDGRTRDNHWILLDQQHYQLHLHEIRIFHISYSNFPIVELKISNTGKNACNNDALEIGAFDIFGQIEI